MQPDNIPIVTVSYNSPDLIDALLRTLRQFCPNPVYVIDGSQPDMAQQVGEVTRRYANVQFIPFGYNIHHGPGMAWAVRNLDLHGPVLFLDSDVEILRGDFIASLADALKPGMYGVGNVGPVNEQGYDRADGPVSYLHPACMLCNIEVMRQWPMPIKHGAPMILATRAIYRAGRSAELLRHVPWVGDDFSAKETHNYIKHRWRGTVERTGGYHYDLPSQGSAVNQLLLAFAPNDAHKVVDIGCGDGSFAKVYKSRNLVCDYTGVEINPQLADLARPHCDFVFCCDIEQPPEQLYRDMDQADLWFLGDVLGALRDPWAVLANIRRHCAPGAKLVLSVRNAQHWGLQARLSVGDLRYGPKAALGREEVRLFTRGSVLSMLQEAGFRVAGGAPVTREESGNAAILALIGQMAVAAGFDGAMAQQDAQAYEYVIVAEAA